MARQFQTKNAAQSKREFETDWERVHAGRPYNGAVEEPLPRPRLASEWTPTHEDQFPGGIDFTKLKRGNSPTPRWSNVVCADGVAIWITNAALKRGERLEYRRRVHEEQLPPPREQFRNSYYERD